MVNSHGILTYLLSDKWKQTDFCDKNFLSLLKEAYMYVCIRGLDRMASAGKMRSVCIVAHTKHMHNNNATVVK